MGWLFMIFGSLNLFGGIFSYCYVIETVGKTNNEIMILYAKSGGWTEKEEQIEEELI